MFFEESAADRNVQKALLAARRLRRELREQDEVKPATRQPPVYDRST